MRVCIKVQTESSSYKTAKGRESQKRRIALKPEMLRRNREIDELQHGTLLARVVRINQVPHGTTSLLVRLAVIFSRECLVADFIRRNSVSSEFRPTNVHMEKF